jgi:hypothetical protein
MGANPHAALSNGRAAELTHNARTTTTMSRAREKSAKLTENRLSITHA